MRLLSRIAASAVAMGGCLVLAGWLLENSYLKSFVPGLVAMNPATAIMFVACAAAIALHSEIVSHWSLRLLRWILAGIVLGGALLIVLGFIFDWQTGFDRILFAEALGENRMAPNTAVYFIFLGLALVSLETGWAKKWPSQALALIVLGGALVSLLGYGYGAKSLYGIGGHIPMALNTALLFMLASTGLLCVHGGRGILEILTGRGSGSLVARRLLPTAVIVPCILGFLRVIGQRAGLYDTEFGAALMVVGTVVLLVAAIMFTAGALNRSDMERARAVEELRQAHLELQGQSQILQSILNNMGDGVVVADERGKFTLFNPAAERILGVGAADVGPEAWTEQYGCFLADGVTPYPSQQLPLARALRGEALDEEELFIRNAGIPQGAWISITGRPLRDAQGGLRGGVTVFRDVSERKHAEETLRKSNEELERRVTERTKELADANRDLTQKNQENEMFVYSVSHDLRSPLVNLQGFSKELGLAAAELSRIVAAESLPPMVREKAAGLLNGDIRESIRFIQTAVMRLSNIIDALLRLSRVGRIEYQTKVVHTKSLVGAVVESLGSTLFDAGISIRVENLSPCYGDSTAIEQLFANLIGNAIKYRDPARPTVIDVDEISEGPATLGDTRTYFVKDNGLGIPQAHQDKIFQAFKRAHPNVASGEGMGLAIVRRIVDRHGGKVWVESQVGQGSTFYVTLPIRRPAGEQSPLVNHPKEGDFADAQRATGDLIGRGR